MTAPQLPPGRRSALLNGLRFTSDPLAYIHSYHRRYGLVASSRFPGIGLTIHLADPDGCPPDDIHDILNRGRD